jgi:hypothetical protein
VQDGGDSLKLPNVESQTREVVTPYVPALHVYVHVLDDA